MIYLDNAATTFPKPREVVEEMIRQYQRIGVSPGRGSYDLAIEAEEFIKQTRVKIADFFRAPEPERIIFTANATDGLNLAISGLVQPGDHVITTWLEHNSVLRPLCHLEKQKQITCSLIPFNSQGFINPEDIIEAIRPETRLVIVTHASNVLGTIQPIAEVGGICAEHGILFLVDASQSAGQIEVDMAAMQASVIAFTGHKSLYGPTGIGGLVIHPNVDIQATRFGGTGIESESLFHPDRYPHRLEAGTLNLLGIIGLSLGIDYLLSKDLTTIHQKAMGLLDRLYTGLSKIAGIEFYGGTSLANRLPLLTVNLHGFTPEDVGAILDADFNIAARVGLHCAPLLHEALGTVHRGAIRFSIGHFNTEMDIDRLIQAMGQISKIHC
jgi:cysteine desulfurase / selenocysteine lyase